MKESTDVQYRRFLLIGEGGVVLGSFVDNEQAERYAEDLRRTRNLKVEVRNPEGGQQDANDNSEFTKSDPLKRTL